MQKCKAEILRSPTGPDQQVRLEVTPGFAVQDGSSDGKFTLDVKMRILDADQTLSRESDAMTSQLRVIFEAIYDFEDASDMTSTEAEAFCLTVAQMTLWPFARAQINSLGNTMGLGDLLLPVLLSPASTD